MLDVVHMTVDKAEDLAEANASVARLQEAALGLLADRSWAVVVEILHLDPFEKARLAGEYTMRAIDRRTGDLVVVPPASAQLVHDLLDAEWLHSQDVLLTERAPA